MTNPAHILAVAAALTAAPLAVLYAAALPARRTTKKKEPTR